MQYRIDDKVSQDDARIVRRGLVDFANQFTEPRNYKDVEYVVRDTEECVCGGLLGNTIWTWLRIDVLWVSEDLRGQGLGRQLIERAELLANSRGCQYAMVDTFDFEAREFYEKLGYVLQSQTEDFPVGHTHFHLKKVL